MKYNYKNKSFRRLKNESLTSDVNNLKSEVDNFSDACYAFDAILIKVIDGLSSDDINTNIARDKLEDAILVLSGTKYSTLKAVSNHLVKLLNMLIKMHNETDTDN